MRIKPIDRGCINITFIIIASYFLRMGLYPVPWRHTCQRSVAAPSASRHRPGGEGGGGGADTAGRKV